MILYTIVHPGFIFFGRKNDGHKDEEVVHFKTIEMEKMKLEVVPLGQGLYRINRIISTNPFDYLKPQLQPGSEIKLY